MGLSLASGDLDEYVTIQSRTVTQDALGGEVITWGTLSTAWAKIDAKGVSSSGENYSLEQTHAFNNYEVTLHWRSDVNATHRISWAGAYGTKYLNIQGVTADTKRRWLKLRCVEGLTDGR